MLSAICWLYCLISWSFNRWAISLDGLGLMAPLAGLPFLVLDLGGDLSSMSYNGQGIHSFIAAEEGSGRGNQSRPAIA